ncbi:MAG: hypothetical protein Q7T82_16120 [Armatimonadota bacterium]|nr:hypothetical protein [Armatimonadota bacterium]
MNEALKNLYSVQEIDSRILAAKRAMAGLDNGSSTKAQVEQAEMDYKQLEDKLRGLEAELKDCELNLKTVENKKQGYERRLYAGEVTNPKELEGMEKEIGMLKRNQDKLETRVLELMDAAQEQQGLVSESRSRLERLQAELSGKMETYDNRSKELSEEIAKATADRTAAADTVDEDLLRRYEGIRSRAGGIAVSQVGDGRCGVCHVSLTPFAVRMLKESQEPPTCESCGRMLLAPE